VFDIDHGAEVEGDGVEPEPVNVSVKPKEMVTVTVGPDCTLAQVLEVQRESGEYFVHYYGNHKKNVTLPVLPAHLSMWGEVYYDAKPREVGDKPLTALVHASQVKGNGWQLTPKGYVPVQHRRGLELA
jgi:hypothetical protein